VLYREREDRPSDAAPAYSGHAVDDVVVGVGMPRAIERRVGLVWPGSERKDSERTSLIRHEETVPVRDVFLSVNPARVPVGPLCNIPIRLHESPSMLIRALDELEVVRGSNSKTHTQIILRTTHTDRVVIFKSSEAKFDALSGMGCHTGK